MKNSAILFLVVVILLLGAGNYIQYRSAVKQESYRKDENERFQVEQFRKLGQISKRDSVVAALLDERAADSARHAKSQGSLISQIKAIKSRIVTPSAVHDSVIVLQDSLIADLQNEVDTLYLTDRTAIDSLQASVLQLKVMYQEQYHRASKFELQYEQEKRKRWSLGPHAGYGFTGPEFGVSIQYSLWRF